MLRYTFFVYLITSKISGFKSTIAYNTYFQFTLDKLCNSTNTLPDGLKLAAYFHSIKGSYPDFSIADGSAFQRKIYIIFDLMVKLEDER